MTTTTKTPWAAYTNDGRRDMSGGSHASYGDAIIDDGQFVGTEGDMQAIVRAVNAHDDLVRFVRECARQDSDCGLDVRHAAQMLLAGHGLGVRPRCRRAAFVPTNHD